MSRGDHQHADQRRDRYSPRQHDAAASNRRRAISDRLYRPPIQHSKPPTVFEQYSGHDCHRCHLAAADDDLTTEPAGDGTLFYVHRNPCTEYAP